MDACAALLLGRLKDPNENAYVKDTAAWTIARVCEFVPAVITPTNLNDILLHFFQALEQVRPGAVPPIPPPQGNLGQDPERVL